MKMDVLIKTILISVCLSLVSGQCPWPESPLNTSCKCTSPDSERKLEISCNNVDFGLLIAALKNVSTEDSQPIGQLFITNTTIGILPDSIFNQTKIVELKLTKSQIRIIGDNAFTGIAKHLRALSLQENLLTSVPLKALAKLPSLTNLDLSRNQIASLGDGAFANLKAIENIDLSDNEMKISNGAFSGLESHLKLLNLKGTGQKEVPPAVLNISSLEHLDLAQNQISKLKPNGMKNLNKLEWLNLERNMIVQLDKDAFEGIGSTLRTLSLLNNILLVFPKEGLAKLANLRVLDIGFNGIRSMPDDSFATIKFLRLLAIEGNPLATIPEAAFKHLKATMLGISFGGRYLVCDCRIKWIAEWVRDINIRVTSRERNPQFCGSPAELEPSSFYKISVDKLKCDEPLTTTTTTTSTTTVITTTPYQNTLPVEEDKLNAFEESDTKPSTPLVLFTDPVFKSAGPPIIPPPPPPILRVGDRPPRPDFIPTYKNGEKGPKKPSIQEIDLTKAERQGNSIAVQWEALTTNAVGYQVIYRTFAKKQFQKSETLSAATRHHILQNLPDDQCCFVVCVVSSDTTDFSEESLPKEQCTEINTPSESEAAASSNMDKIIIGVSAAICFLIIVAVIIFCICSCSKKRNKEKHYPPHPPIEPLKLEPDWDRTSMYSIRSIPRARLYHDTKSNGSINNDYLHDDGRAYSLSHIPNGYQDNYSRSMMPDVHSQRSASRNSYIPHVHQPSLGRQSAHSISQMSTRHSQMGMTPPVEQRRKRLDRVGRVGGISAASSLHSLTSYEQEAAMRHENWNDHDMEIYVGRNHVAQSNGKSKGIYR